MAVFRIEKTRDYTVMSNHHLKDKTLTLKSKGLLSMMLSLPEEWNYTTRGLAAICREGVDSIGAALKELETRGYIKRSQLRDEKGKIRQSPSCEDRRRIAVWGAVSSFRQSDAFHLPSPKTSSVYSVFCSAWRPPFIIRVWDIPTSIFLFSGKGLKNAKNPQVGTHLLCLLSFLPSYFGNAETADLATFGAKKNAIETHGVHGIYSCSLSK